MTKILAVIPTYNEQKHIGEIVQKTKQYVDEVVVTDDNSKDGTIKIAHEQGAYVVVNKSNYRGVGFNTKRGIYLALKQGANIVVTLDGDGQHNPEDIPRIIKPILESKADLVIGDRFTNYKTIPLYRRLGISVITSVFNFGAYYKTGDAQCGYRAYSRRFLEKLTIEEQGFAFIVESLVKCRKLGFKIYDVPVICVYHQDIHENSTIHPIKQGIFSLLSLIKWRLKVEVFKR